AKNSMNTKTTTSEYILDNEEIILENVVLKTIINKKSNITVNITDIKNTDKIKTE
ncbi:17258_t:CDS:1, partial [Cetraspora pellucida]